MKDAKREKVMIPYPLTDSDKADMADSLIELKEKSNALEQERVDYIKGVNDEKKELDNKMNFQFDALKNGTKNIEEECRVRKNFEKEPPMVEYVHLTKDKVLHEIEMPAEAYQLEAKDWVKGESKAVPPMETPGEKLDEED